MPDLTPYSTHHLDMTRKTNVEPAPVMSCDLADALARLARGIASVIRWKEDIVDRPEHDISVGYKLIDQVFSDLKAGKVDGRIVMTL